MDEAIAVLDIPGDGDLQAPFAIRRQVFVREQGIPEPIDFDGQDVRCTHVLLRYSGRDAATGRLLYLENNLAEAARIAVLPDYRGRGLGRRVVAELERLAKGGSVDRVRLHPHKHLAEFYHRLGYRLAPGWEQELCGHRLLRMEKRL